MQDSQAKELDSNLWIRDEAEQIRAAYRDANQRAEAAEAAVKELKRWTKEQADTVSKKDDTIIALRAALADQRKISLSYSGEIKDLRCLLTEARQEKESAPETPDPKSEYLIAELKRCNRQLEEMLGGEQEFRKRTFAQLQESQHKARNLEEQIKAGREIIDAKQSRIEELTKSALAYDALIARESERALRPATEKGNDHE